MRRRRSVRPTARWLVYFGMLTIATGAKPDGQPAMENLSVLAHFSDSVRTLASRVAPSVVQIVVDHYATGTSADGRVNHEGEEITHSPECLNGREAV